MRKTGFSSLGTGFACFNILTKHMKKWFTFYLSNYVPVHDSLSDNFKCSNIEQNILLPFTSFESANFGPAKIFNFLKFAQPPPLSRHPSLCETSCGAFFGPRPPTQPVYSLK
jgi:hypothetical protein